MKRLLLFALSAVLLVACNKTDQETPSIAWPANPKFSVFELGAGGDSMISLNAPAKIESATLALGLGDYAMLANNYISIASNQGTSNKAPVFDIVDDSKVASFLTGMGMAAGKALRGQTMSSLNLEAILTAILANQQTMPNDINFTIDIKLTDASGRSVAKLAKFHYTVPPTITWSDNTDFSVVDLNSYSPAKPGPSSISISAPGKIQDLKVKLEFGAAPELEKYISNRTTNKGLVIDLINDPLAEDSFKFPSPKVITGKTAVKLDFSFIYGLIPDLSASTNVFTVEVVDGNNKPCSVQLKFKK